MEQILEEVFSKEVIAISVGAIMSGGIKELVSYTGMSKESEAIFESIKSQIKLHEIQYIIQEAPQWEVYRTYGPSMKN